MLMGSIFAGEKCRGRPPAPPLRVFFLDLHVVISFFFLPRRCFLSL